MHKNLIRAFYFINEFIESDINKLNKNISIIYRNYNKNIDKNIIREIKEYCKRSKRKFYISYHYNLALKFKLDGIYVPAFDKRQILSTFLSMKNFEILGSAHNIKELKIKEKQGCETIFISPIFKVKKTNYCLDTIKFNFLAKNTKKNVVALGGINSKNINKINLTKSKGLASITLIKKNGLNKFRPFFKF
tara:strand:- start:1133 stop:1705 length:573 start_codon:yes stop_codon:yes gene_type:complete